MARELIHEVLPVGLLQCNCSILGDPETGEAIVVDPGDEVEYIIDALKRKNLRVRAILSTHAHIDHVGGLARLHEVTGAPVLMHPEDYPLYQRMEMQAQWLGVAPPPLVNIDAGLKEGDSITWGPWEARILHTPGHTPGSVSLYIPLDRSGAPAARTLSSAHSAGPSDAAASSVQADTPLGGRRPGYTGWLLAGDTLFAGSIGRTDLWGGDLRTILSSLHEKLMALPDATRVYPGHGAITSIGEERQSNPFLRRR
jgi:glyoxylase-like metal-dependent hydrolase (beta-lactamase superfamily II)